MAVACSDAHSKALWLEIAETWLRMVPQAERAADEQFRGALDLTTGQEPSTSEH
jgi:ferritin-like protein